MDDLKIFNKDLYIIPNFFNLQDVSLTCQDLPAQLKENQRSLGKANPNSDLYHNSLEKDQKF